MKWNLSFISEEDFTNHVRATIDKYGEKLESFDIVRFNKNIIDPIKMIFDKTVYQSTWEEIVSNEIFRQRDKSNNNDIGYFHQRIFQYIVVGVKRSIHKLLLHLERCHASLHLFLVLLSLFIAHFYFLLIY